MGKRSVKEALKITLKERTPRFDVLNTLLIEAEHIVNSRPITYVSSNEEDLESLTPNHFIIGTSITGENQQCLTSGGNFC